MWFKIPKNTRLYLNVVPSTSAVPFQVEVGKIELDDLSRGNTDLPLTVQVVVIPVRDGWG